MRLLVFAASDSDGANLADRSKAWTELLRQGLEERTGMAVQLTYRQLYVHGKSWERYFEATLAEADADIIIVAVNGVSWAFRTVPIRIRKLLGNRAGRWVEDQRRGLATAASKRSVLRPVASGLRWTVRRLVPPGSYLSRAEAERRWLAVIDRVAREESAECVILNKVFQRGDLLSTWPGLNAVITEHNGVLKQRTSQRHLKWFDREAILTAMGDEAGFLEDRLHRQVAFHEKMAGQLLELLAPVAHAVAPRPRGATPSRAVRS
jgi:hypothetical protein